MTKQEFEKISGIKISDDTFRDIEKKYMNTDLEKEAFCKLLVENPAALREIEIKTSRVRELVEERKRLVNFLIEQAQKWSATDLREKAIAMVGEKEYIRLKLETGCNLWKADKELILEFLK